MGVDHFGGVLLVDDIQRIFLGVGGSQLALGGFVDQLKLEVFYVLLHFGSVYNHFFGDLCLLISFVLGSDKGRCLFLFLLRTD